MSLVIYDDYVEEVKQHVKGQCEALETILNSYIRIMNTVIKNGITDGKTAEALKEFVCQVESNLSSKNITPLYISNRAERYCTNFVKRVDDADEDLY